MRFAKGLIYALFSLLITATSVWAAGDGEHHVSPGAQSVSVDWSYITNSVLMAAIACGLITWFVSSAMKQRSLVPDAKQNFVEMLVEFLYGQVENIVGKKVAPRAFPLLGTIFVFILVSNYMGLVPGVGTIGFKDGNHIATPLLRPSTADINMTLAIAVVSTFVWAWLTFKEVGVWGFLVHTFGPKGGLKGFMGIVVALIFFIVGIIEIVSILFRPVSLSARLYGNIFAGESLLHTMSGMADKNTSPVLAFLFDVLLPLPFYFMELLVGALQAMVFTLLVAVYIQLTTTHEEHEHEEHGHADDKAPAH
jgi:F-type H+-transporting ATPase subunit a